MAFNLRPLDLVMVKRTAENKHRNNTLKNYAREKGIPLLGAPTGRTPFQHVSDRSNYPQLIAESKDSSGIKVRIYTDVLKTQKGTGASFSRTT